jgi:hypothetical protein
VFTSTLVGGAVIGVIAALRHSAHADRAHRALLAALASGGRPVARALLERTLPPFQHIIPDKVPKQRERMAALTLLDDVDALETELAAHRGRFATLARLNAVALIGIAVRTTGDARAHAIARLDELGAAVERDAGRMHWQLKRETHALVALGHGLIGVPIAPPDIAQLAKLAYRGTLGLVVSHALVAGFAASGLPGQAETCRRRVRAATDAFEPPPMLPPLPP